MNVNENLNAFPEYLRSIVKLDALQRMTDDLDNELADSQRIMGEIKTMFDTIPRAQGTTDNSAVRHEDLSQFLETNPPTLLMEDMMPNATDVDLDAIIATMKGYAEELRRTLVVTVPQPRSSHRSAEVMDLEGYAVTLDQLGKRLANIKLTKSEEADNKNAQLEAKLSQLCEDVNMFTQMVQAKAALSEGNSNWTVAQEDTNTLFYDNIINKLLAGINEVTYLLKNTE